MSDDWIKVRTGIYRDPKVSVMADALSAEDGPLARYVNQNEQRNMTVTRNVTRNAVVGALVTVWGVTRHRGKRYGDDLKLAGVTAYVIDDIADLPGFGEAMVAAGWATETDEGLTLPNFFEDYNEEPSAYKRSANAERQKRYRDKHNNSALRNVTEPLRVTLHSNDREEKRREEKNNPPYPPKGEEGGGGDRVGKFRKFWESAHAEHGPTVWQVNANERIAELLAAFPKPTELAARVARFMADDDAWIPEHGGWTLAVFCGRVDKYAKRKAKAESTPSPMDAGLKAELEQRRKS